MPFGQLKRSLFANDETVASLQLPLLYPADAREIVTFGLHGFALSRHTGSWVALKILTDVADATRLRQALTGAASVVVIGEDVGESVEDASGLRAAAGGCTVSAAATAVRFWVAPANSASS